MKTAILLSVCTIIATQARKLPCYACLNSVCYSPYDQIFSNHKLTGQLAVDRKENIIYYHYENNGKDFTKAFDLNKANSTFIPRNFSFAFAVDQGTRDLYLSGEKGVYKYNPITNTIELYGLKDKTIWHMQFEERLYYTEFRQKGLFYMQKQKIKEIPELNKYRIDDFVIDKQDDIYFTSKFALYVLKKGSNKAELFEDEIYFLTTDKYREAYFIQPYTRGIHKIDYRNGKLIEVGAFKRGLPFKVIFDGDNHIVFYESKNKILYYLSPVLSRCTVTNRGVGKSLRKVVLKSPNGHNTVRVSSHRRAKTNSSNKTSKVL